MAGNSIIGALRVVLGADTAALEKGLKEARGSLSSFGAGMGKIGASAAASFAAIGTAVALAVRGSISEADKLNKLSQSIGIPVEQLSALKYAAELSDISLQQLGTSLGKLGRNLTEAAAKPMSEAANAFRALGVATTDSNGKLRSQNDVLLDIAQKFSGLKDGAGKTAVAMAIFGRAGADMIPFLNQGRDGIKELTDRAAELGIVIDKETAARAEKFNDTMKDIGAVFKGIVVQVAAQMLPTFVNLAKTFFDAAKNSDSLKTAAAGLAFTLQTLVTAGILVAGVFKSVGEIVSGVAAAVLLVAQGQFSAALEALKMGGQDADATMRGMADTIKKVWSSAVNDGAVATDRASKSLKDFNYSALGGKNAIDQFLDALAKKKAGLEAEIQTVAMNTAEQEKAKVVLEGLAIAKAKHIPISEQLIERLNREGAAFGKVAETAEDAKERFNAIKSSMGGISSKFEDALVGLIDGSKKAKEAFKDMAKGIISDLIRLVIRLQITLPLAKALTSMFGGAFMGGPQMVVGGAGMRPVPTFASGGSFKVGGVGGTDSKLMQFRATPGEMVSITKGNTKDDSAGVVVNLFEGAGGERNQQRTRRGPGGETIIDLLTRSQQASIESGKMDAPLFNRTGLRPSIIAR